MTIYVVGDLQGCLECLKALLDKLRFEPGQDQLWCAGDLVNRGPESLETLRFCKALGDNFRTVLGNHDLSLLAIASGAKSPSRKDTIEDILQAPDREELLAWLRAQPLMLRNGDYSIVHAGIPPQWSVDDAARHARELELALAEDDTANTFFGTMFGNDPACWRDDLTGQERLRAITNYFTRMRFCDQAGCLDFDNKLGPDQAPPGYLPWFEHRNRRAANSKIIFGHWASLEGKLNSNVLFPLDTGCVWGGRLRAMSLDDETYTHVQCGSGGSRA